MAGLANLFRYYRGVEGDCRSARVVSEWQLTRVAGGFLLSVYGTELEQSPAVEQGVVY